LDMKQFFAGAMLLTCLSLPASASSIELVDDIVTGPKGKSSFVTLGPVTPCDDSACVDGTGGDPKLKTASAFEQIALATRPVKKINFDFARKFPDPASPVAAAPAEADAAGAPALQIPKAPADSGTIAAQPPVGSAAPNDPAAIGAPTGATQTTETRGTIDPNLPAMPIVNSELRDGE
jgi:hypothetical protein